MCCSAVSNANTYRARLEMGEFPSLSSLTYEGKINENTYPIENRETERMLSAEFSNASFINPINNKKEIFIGALTKSRCDGVGKRDCNIDILIVMDISPSMDSALGKSNKSCLSLAKTASIKLLDQLKSGDRFGFAVFDTNADEIFPVQKLGNNKQNIINQINKLKTRGGTTLIEGMNLAYSMMKKVNEEGSQEEKAREKRIVFLTDMGDVSSEQKFFETVKQASNEGIYLTIVGIGYNFNEDSALKISFNKGANFFNATEEQHLEEFLIQEFDFNFFPTCFNSYLHFSSVNYDLIKTYGSDYKANKSKIKAEWKTETHKLYDIQFRKTVFFLMLLYKRMKNRIPKPVIALLANYLNSNYSVVNEINTMTPSILEKEEESYMLKGGLLLLKLNPKRGRELTEKIDGTISFNYNEYDGTSQFYSNNYAFQPKNEEYFSSFAIKK